MIYTGRLPPSWQQQEQEQEEAAAEAAEGGGNPTADFALGSVVEAHSLLKAAHLNGQRGVIVSTQSMEAGRVGVSFSPPLGRKAIMTCNLRLVA
jgi:hypothetical protein